MKSFVEYPKNRKGRHTWRVQADNGQIVSSSHEDFHSKSVARRAFRKAAEHMVNAVERDA